MNKLFSVVLHEYLTVVKQPSFWIYLIITPLIFISVSVLLNIAERSDTDTVKELTEKLQQVVIIDASGLLSSEVIEQSGQELQPVSSFDELRAEVESGERKGLIYYPENLVKTQSFEVHVSGLDFTFNNSVSELGRGLLRASLYLPLGSEEVILLAQSGAEGITTTYANGTTSVGYSRFIIPGLVGSLFFIILFFSIGYVLTSIADEKENRSMEMALTYLGAKTLIVGKLIAITLITISQILFYVVVAGVSVFVALRFDFLNLPPDFDISNLPVDWVAVSLAIVFVLLGYLLFASFMAFIAAIMPSKQANNYSAFFYILPFAPFWFLMTVLTDPENPVVKLITHFPVTAPTTVLIRNTVGNIEMHEALLSLGIMTATMLIVMWLVIKVFPKGALEFENTLSLKTIFGR